MTLRYLVIFLLSLVLDSVRSDAQTPDSVAAQPLHVRISLITGGPGLDPYESFGHTCIRVTDSTKTGRDRDVIYNYGFFDPAEGSATYKALNDRIRVFLEKTTYEGLIVEYTDKKRKLEEQELLLTDAQKKKMLDFLAWNMKRENRYYDYASLTDNCSTRNYNLFLKTLNPGFVPGKVLPADSKITYRDIYVHTFFRYERKTLVWFTSSLFHAHPADLLINDTTACFIPEILKETMAGATINGRKVCAPSVVLLEEKIDWPAEADWPLFIFLALALMAILGAVTPRFVMIGNISAFISLIFTALLGLFIIRLWSLDGGEPAFKYNFNLLWALPTNILFPFLKGRAKARYCLVGIVGILLSLLVHLFRIQDMPVKELCPLWLALIFVFGYHYRKGRMRETSKV